MMRTSSRCARAAGACALAVALSVPLAGCGMFGGEGEPEIAANVAGTEISAERVNELFARFASTEAGAATMTDKGDGLRVSEEQVKANVLSLEIKVTFLEVLAEREGVVVPDTPPESEDLFQDFADIGTLQAAGYQAEDLKMAQRAGAIGMAIAARLLPEVSITDEELKAAFAERRKLFDSTFKSTAGVAFMDSLESANQLRQGLADGKDFDEAIAAVEPNVVAESVVDINPLSAPIAKELVDALAKLDAGETSAPFEYDLEGVPLLVVLHQIEREDLPAVSLEDAKPDLVEIITNRKRKDVYDDWLKRQYLDADISVDDYYGRWEPNLQAVI